MSGAPPRNDPDVTVVIPTLGRPILRRMLAAVTAGGTWPARVIVVDQGRKPEIAAFADEARRSVSKSCTCPRAARASRPA